MDERPLDGEVRQSVSLLAMTAAATGLFVSIGLLAGRLFG